MKVLDNGSSSRKRKRGAKPFLFFIKVFAANPIA